jgi:hypothetical protein
MMAIPRQLGCGLLAAGATLMLSVASAAEPVGTVARISGAALINQGERYEPAKEGMAIKEGDRMMATEGSSAVIKFKDGCEYTLTDTQVLTVGATSTCRAGGAVAAAAPSGLNPGLAFAGAAALVVGGVALVANQNSNNNDGPRAAPGPPLITQPTPLSP